MITPRNAEDELQLRFLNTPQGEAGSGAMRYAAAMYFFQHGMIGERELEEYRARSKVGGTPGAIRSDTDRPEALGNSGCGREIPP